MDLLSLLLIAWISTNQIYVEDTYSENIEYCANIIYNPNLEQEFYANCNLEQVNSYIIDTKRNWY
jgi:hypothetical protein